MNRGKKSFPSRLSPPKPDWKRETRELDRKLSEQIERLLEQKERLRETTDRVAGRPPLKRNSQEDQSSGLLPGLRPPPADYIDGPRGKNKKKKNTEGELSPLRAPALSTPAGLAKRVNVVEEVTLRGRDLIPISRYHFPLQERKGLEPPKMWPVQMVR